MAIILLGDTMKPLKERISITIDNDLLERLRYEAERDDRSLSQYINLVLRKHIHNLDKGGKEVRGLDEP